MQITDIKIYHLDDDDSKSDLKPSRSKLKAFATVVFDNELVIRDFRIIQTDKGYFVGMPCRKTSDGKWIDIVFPISTNLAKEIQDNIIKAYKDELEILIK